jgi:uncharacterized SAM-binding protein YcdF (DUF218 family)
VIIRFLAACALVWVLGFAVFVLVLPEPAPDTATDAIIVLTGGPGRIQRGIALLQANKAQRMLVSGVDRRVAPEELARENDAPVGLFRSRVDLGQESVDTRSNADESAAWMRRHHYRTVRLITTDWHMPRARFELSRVLSPEVMVIPDAVESEPGIVPLVKEYNKYLLRRMASLLGV